MAPSDRRPGDRSGRRGITRHLARAGRTVGGVALILAGLAMLVLPGPGLLAIAAGLSLLAVDYAWARRLHGHVRRRLVAAAGQAQRGWRRLRRRRSDR